MRSLVVLLVLAASLAAAEDPVDRFLLEQLERYRLVKEQSRTKVLLGDQEVDDTDLKRDLADSIDAKIALYERLLTAPDDLQRAFVVYLRHNEIAGLCCQRYQVQQAGGDVTDLEAKIAELRQALAEVAPAPPPGE